MERTDRISREEAFLDIALVFAKRSTCERGQTGCVITLDNRIISTGYNGPTKGADHCGEGCNTSLPCTRSVHAEANAIYFAARNGIRLNGSVLYTTHSPCLKCCEAIVQAGIYLVIYMETFRETDGFRLLDENNVMYEMWINKNSTNQHKIVL